MVVTGSATYSQAQPDRACRIDTVFGVHHQNFLLDRPAFARRNVAAIEARRDHLIARRVRQQVARDLFDRKFIKRLIPVERANHPIAIRPHLAIVVVM